MKIVSARRFALWTKLAQRWLKKQLGDAVASIATHADDNRDAIIATLPKETAEEEIDSMFE